MSKEIKKENKIANNKYKAMADISMGRISFHLKKGDEVELNEKQKAILQPQILSGVLKLVK